MNQCLCLLGFIFCLSSCITPFQPDTVSVAPMLIVDGQITDQPGPYTIKLTRTSDYSIRSVNLLEEGATVLIMDDQGNQETLKETATGGTYQSRVNGLRGVPGRRYKLIIQTKAGKRYESEPEVLPAVPPIQKLYYESTYEPATAKANQRQIWSIYLDTKDPDTLGNYYKWSWTHYEMPTACQKTFISARSYYTGISCCTDCWDIFRCYTCVNLNSDMAINGKAISRQFIAEVPFTSLSRYYVEVEQQALSKRAYLFWKSVAQLTSNTGGLFDVSPSSVRGNIKCTTTPDEPVYGYFGAVGVAINYVFVDRSTGQGAPDLDFPTSIPYPTNPACIVCENSQYRTPNKPRFWTY